MENFIYSINATIPVFLVMIIGYILKQMDILDEHFANKANKFNFKVTLPCLAFSDLASTDMKSTFDLSFVLFCAMGSVPHIFKRQDHSWCLRTGCLSR